MSHAGIAAVIIGVTVASVLYFLYRGNQMEQHYSYGYNRSYSGPRSNALDGCDDCPICLCPLTQENIQVLSSCRHRFHRRCINELKRHASERRAICPICRSQIS